MQVEIYHCACALCTKWQLRHPETPVHIFCKSVCNKRSSMISYGEEEDEGGGGGGGEEEEI